MVHFNEQPQDVFTAIFAVTFGAMAAGNAQQFAPDLGKANSAADKIFSITDEDSKIDTLSAENQANGETE